MAEGTRVDADQSQMAKATQQFDDASAKTRETMSRFQAAVDELMAMYKGRQAVQFSATAERVRQVMTTCQQRLTQAGGMVKAASDGYVSEDERVATTFQGVGGDMDPNVFSRMTG